MEKKWDTVIPAGLKRLFVIGTCMYYPAGQERVNISLKYVVPVDHKHTYKLCTNCYLEGDKTWQQCRSLSFCMIGFNTGQTVLNVQLIAE
jgi:hypothetical protein